MRVYKPKRRSFTTYQLLCIFDASGGRCHWCGVKLRVGEAWTPDHVARLADGGPDSLANIKPIHRRCHLDKNAQEAAVAAKADRTAARHWGIERPPARPFPGSRASPWKKKLDGTIERRPTKRCTDG